MSCVACTTASRLATTQKSANPGAADAARDGHHAAGEHDLRPDDPGALAPEQVDDRAPEEFEGDGEVKERRRADLRVRRLGRREELGPHLVEEAHGSPSPKLAVETHARARLDRLGGASIAASSLAAPRAANFGPRARSRH